jgi:hypothetical protein
VLDALGKLYAHRHEEHRRGRPAMTTAHQDKLRLLTDATKRLEGDPDLTFDDVVELCLQQLKQWPRGSTAAARTEISWFLRAAGGRANHLIVP